MTYKVFSLFSGMGGMDIGFSYPIVVRKESIVDLNMIHESHSIEGFVRLKLLPFEIVFQNDILPIAKQITEWNNWCCSNYSLIDIKELLKNSEFPYYDNIDVVIGGFPCQDFSHAGKRKGLGTERGTLYHSFVEIIKRVRPLIFVAENVHGLLTMPGVIEIIKNDFSDCGYRVEYQLVKCEEHGIPQTRWRIIIMGIRLDKNHLVSDNWNLIKNNKTQCPVGYYLKHLQEPEYSPDPAQQVFSNAARLEKGQGQKEIVLTKFSPTIRAEHHGNIEFRRIKNGENKEEHLKQRRLTIREVSLIQTFPPDCILTNPNGKKTGSAYKPIGNAVPPLLSYLIALKVNEILSKIT